MQWKRIVCVSVLGFMVLLWNDYDMGRRVDLVSSAGFLNEGDYYFS